MEIQKKEYPINIIELDKIFILFDGDTKKEYPTTIIELFLIIRFFIKFYKIHTFFCFVE